MTDNKTNSDTYSTISEFNEKLIDELFYEAKELRKIINDNAEKYKKQNNDKKKEKEKFFKETMYRIADMLNDASTKLKSIESEYFDTFDDYKSKVSEVYKEKIRKMKRFEEKCKKRSYPNFRMSIKHVRKILQEVLKKLQDKQEEMTDIEELKEAIKQSYIDRDYEPYIETYDEKDEDFQAEVYRAYAVYLEVKTFLIF